MHLACSCDAWCLRARLKMGSAIARGASWQQQKDGHAEFIINILLDETDRGTELNDHEDSCLV